MTLADDPKRAVALGGAIALGVGAFTPLMRKAGGGHATLMGGQPSDAATLLVLAGGSVVLVLLGWYGGLWLTAGGALTLLGASYVNLALRLTPFVPARDDGTVEHALASHAGLSWGWLVLGLGVALLLVAAALRERIEVSVPRPRTTDDVDDAARALTEAREPWSVLATGTTGETRHVLRGMLWEMNRNRSEAEIQALLNADEIPVASGLTAAEANQLMTRLYEAGVAAHKRRTPTT